MSDLYPSPLALLAAPDDGTGSRNGCNFVARRKRVVLERPIESFHPLAVVDPILSGMMDSVVCVGEAFTEEVV
jgi:hypothetical protein